MSNAVVNLPERRPNSANDDTPEKRLKIGDHLPTVDSAMKLQSGVKDYCLICVCSTDHNHLRCPKRSMAIGWACSICCQPCDIKEHEGNWRSLIKTCLYCTVIGDHWSKGCPDPIDDDCDSGVDEDRIKSHCEEFVTF